MNKRKTTKDKLVFILKKDGEITIKQLMEYFTISEIAVRKHLADLIRDKIIRERIVKQDIGRPYHMYSLTKKGHQMFPNQYESLPVQLLDDLGELYGEKAVNELLAVRKKKEEAELKEKLDTEDFNEKIKKFIEHQEQKGYMIEYEKTDDGSYELKNFNCPIFNVAEKYTQICDNEKLMYNNLFSKSDVQVHSCMTEDASYCYWLISQPKEG